MKSDVQQEMSASWNDKADINAYHWVDSTEDTWDKDAYYERGGSELQAQIIDPLVAYGVTEEAMRGMQVLDIGCGTGRLVRAMAAKATEVTGIDIAPLMIEKAEADNADLTNVRFVLGNGTDLSNFADVAFNLVYSFIVFQHIPQRSVIKHYIAEMYRVLQPDGYVRFQVRGYPGRLPVGMSPLGYRGFNSFYIGIHMVRGLVPVPVIRRYNTVYGAFFKPAEIEQATIAAGFKNVTVLQDEANQRYLWVTAQK